MMQPYKMDCLLMLLFVAIHYFRPTIALPDSPEINNNNNRDIADLIQKYYSDGYSYKKLLRMLSHCHGIYLTYEALEKEYSGSA